MSKNSQILKRVHYLLHRGENLAARRLLSVLLQESPQDESVWVRYVDTFGSRAERKRAFEQWRRAMPNNVHARYGLERDARLNGRTQRPLPLRSIWLDARFGWAILSAVIILSLSSIWVIAQSDNPPLQPLISQLQTQYDSLLNESLTLQTNYEQLQISNEQLQNENIALKGAYERLTVQHHELAADRDELWSKYETAVYGQNQTALELQEAQNLQSQTAAALQEAQTKQANTQLDLENAQEKISNLESIIDLSLLITLQEP